MLEKINQDLQEQNKVNITDWYNLTEEEFETALGYLEGTKVKHLNVKCPVRHEVELLLKQLDKHEKIIAKIKANTVYISGATAHTVEALLSNKNIDSLNFEDMDNTPGLYKIVANALNKNNTIKCLAFNTKEKEDFEEGTEEAFVNMLKTNNTLESLDLGINTLEEDGYIAIVDALKENFTITSLEHSREGLLSIIDETDKGTRYSEDLEDSVKETLKRNQKIKNHINLEKPDLITSLGIKLNFNKTKKPIQPHQHINEYLGKHEIYRIRSQFNTQGEKRIRNQHMLSQEYRYDSIDINKIIELRIEELKTNNKILIPFTIIPALDVQKQVDMLGKLFRNEENAPKKDHHIMIPIKLPGDNWVGLDIVMASDKEATIEIRTTSYKNEEEYNRVKEEMSNIIDEINKLTGLNIKFEEDQVKKSNRVVSNDSGPYIIHYFMDQLTRDPTNNEKKQKDKPFYLTRAHDVELINKAEKQQDEKYRNSYFCAQPKNRQEQRSHTDRLNQRNQERSRSRSPV